MVGWLKAMSFGPDDHPPMEERERALASLAFRIKGRILLSFHSIYAILETNTQERRKLSCIGIQMIFTPFIASATA